MNAEPMHIDTALPSSGPASIIDAIFRGFASMDDRRVFRCVGSLILLYSVMIGPLIPGAGGDVFRTAISVSGIWPIVIGLLGLSSGDLLKFVKP